MHKAIKTVLALVVGLALATGVPLAASASPLAPASIVATHSALVVSNQNAQGDQGNHFAYGHDHKKPKPHPTKPAYPPTKPPKPPVNHHHPFWHGGFWWFPFVFPAHTFHPGAIVYVFITGNGHFSFFGTVTASQSGSLKLGTASSDGSLNAQLKASGAKDLAGQTLNATVTDSSGTSVAQTIKVPSAATTASTVSSVKSADPSSLALSGTYISIATIWGAIGLLVLGLGFLVIQTISRRKHRTQP